MKYAIHSTDSLEFVGEKARATIPASGQSRDVYSGVDVVFHGDDNHYSSPQKSISHVW